MTNEEMERAIKFLLDSQAQLTANLGSLTETVVQFSGTVVRLSGTVEKLSGAVDRTANGVAALLAIAEIHEREIGDLKEAARATDDKLNALISTVDRLVSRRNDNGEA